MRERVNKSGNGKEEATLRFLRAGTWRRYWPGLDQTTIDQSQRDLEICALVPGVCSELSGLLFHNILFLTSQQAVEHQHALDTIGGS